MSDERRPIGRIYGVDPAADGFATFDVGEGGTWTAVGDTADGAQQTRYAKGGMLPGPAELMLTMEMTRDEMLERFAQLGRMISQVGRGFRFTSVGPWTVTTAAPGRTGPRPWYVSRADWAARRRIDSLRRRRRRRGVGRPGTTATRTTMIGNVVLDEVDGDRYRFRAKTPDALDSMRHALAMLARRVQQ